MRVVVISVVSIDCRMNLCIVIYQDFEFLTKYVTAAKATIDI